MWRPDPYNISQAKDIEELKELRVPFDSTKMEMYRVSGVVNSWKNVLKPIVKKYEN
ncbi:MAG: hypothetical protein ACR2NW_07530 [Thermodesulfobacteriota bacterium]